MGVALKSVVHLMVRAELASSEGEIEINSMHSNVSIPSFMRLFKVLLPVREIHLIEIKAR